MAGGIGPVKPDPKRAVKIKAMQQRSAPLMERKMASAQGGRSKAGALGNIVGGVATQMFSKGGYATKGKKPKGKK